MARVMLLHAHDLERSLPADSVFDTRLACWVIEVVSAAALSLTGREWGLPEDVPPGVMAVLALAARRLYTNPDRFTREAEGDYSYGLDASVTNADIFTASERKELLSFRKRRGPKGLQTMSTRRDDVDLGATVYVPTGGKPFPMFRAGDW